MHILNLLKNIYEQRQGSQVRNQHLTKALEEIRLQQSRVEDCVFYRRKLIFILYVDNGIFASASDTAINQEIT